MRVARVFAAATALRVRPWEQQEDVVIEKTEVRGEVRSGEAPAGAAASVPAFVPAPASHEELVRAAATATASAAQIAAELRRLLEARRRA
jgi:hypothetical protein